MECHRILEIGSKNSTRMLPERIGRLLDDHPVIAVISLPLAHQIDTDRGCRRRGGRALKDLPLQAISHREKRAFRK